MTRAVTSLRRFVACVGSALLLCGCYTYSALISVSPVDRAGALTREEQVAARAIVVEIGRAAGFWETDVAKRLSEIEASQPSSWPYHTFVSLGAPGGSTEQRSIAILGEMRGDRREIRIGVGDHERGEPLPATRKMIDDLQSALARAFPDCRVEVTSSRHLHWFAP